MLASMIRPVGRALRPVRAGAGTLAVNRPPLMGVPSTIRVTSPAFDPGHDMPVRFSQDGLSLSPPLLWENLPAGTRSLVLLVEDPDIPLPGPLVHAMVYGIRPELGGLAEGAIPFRLRGRSAEGFGTGRNGLGLPGWTAPTPPPGHGPHHYAFQLLALDSDPVFDWPPGRWYLLQRIKGHVLAKGTLFGVYERP